jgi:hypothetical protein
MLVATVHSSRLSIADSHGQNPTYPIRLFCGTEL